MSERTREAVARELLTILAMKGTPDIIALDCELKKRYSPEPLRPWPFEDAEDAAACFKKVAAEGRKKYEGITVTTDKNILRLTKNS